MAETCATSGKVIYRSHDAISAKLGEFEIAYLCRFCRYWHRGHTKKSARAERRAQKAK